MLRDINIEVLDNDIGFGEEEIVFGEEDIQNHHDAQNVVAEKEDEDKKNQDAEDEEEYAAEDEQLFQTHAPNKRAEKRSRLIIWQEKS